MKAQFDNKVLSSFYLWFDHVLLKYGEAYENVTGEFFYKSEEFLGYQTYASSYSQFVGDHSVSGANIPISLRLGGVDTPVGQEGLYAIDFNKGRSYWQTTKNSQILGEFAIKDFNIYMTNETEDKLLFETRYTERSKIDTSSSGLENDEKSYPIVFLKNMGTNNKPFAFGGHDQTILNIRAIVIADTQFKIDAIGSLFRDRQKTLIPILESSEMPYNAFGYYVGGAFYNYSNTVAGKTESQSCFVDEVFVTRFERAIETKIRELNPNVYTSLIDFQVSNFRFPRIV